MSWLKGLVAILAFVEAGWMLFDGARAVLTGSYTVPASGVHAGQLGPWAKLISGIGIEPQSNQMKWFFIIYGATWLFLILGFVKHRPWARWPMLFAAIGTLWYLPVGTLFSSLQIILLLYHFSKQTPG